MSQLQASGKRQKLIKELQSKILIVEEAIGQVTSIQKTLEDNAEQVKSEIHASVSGHLEQLRNREEQLLRQVDVLTSNQMSLLRTQYAKLYHCLGNLQSSLQCVEDQPNDFNFSTVITKDMESVTRVKSQNQPFFAFLLNNEALKCSVQEFGKIEVSGTLLSFPPPQDSVCLPARVEEYEDGDHHVLYKTLEELKLEKEKCLKLKVSFPKLSGQVNEWLCSSAEKAELDCSGVEKSTVGSVWDVINEVKSRNASTHLKQWLHQMQSADELDEFQMLDFPSEHQSRATSDSIEIVSECSTQWLSKCYNVDDHQKGCFPCASASACCCSNRNIEIENLGSMPCCGYQSSNVTDAKKEDEMWLVGSLTPACQQADFIPSVADVCRANEPCSSFFECVCDENCAAVHVQQLEHFDGDHKANLSPLVAPMLNILYSKASEWVMKQHSKEMLLGEDDDDFKCPASVPSSLKSFHQSDDIRNWLPSITKYENSNFPSDVSPSMEVDNTFQEERWLSESMESGQTSLQEKVAAMFKFYFEPLDSTMWLRGQENRVSTNELANKLKWLALSKNNALEYVEKCGISQFSFEPPVADECAWLSRK